MAISDDWVRDFFRRIDARDTAAFVRAFTDDGRFQFGNGEATVGPAAIGETLGGFYDSIGGLEHEIRGIRSGRWEEGEVRSIEAGVTYTRKDGTRVGPIPVTTTIRFRDARIRDYRIFMDIAPLFAQ